MTGALSGVVVIDCDSPEAMAYADDHLPHTAMVTRTPNGDHRSFRHPGQPIRNSVRLDTGETRIAIDVRGDGGYVVGPGSVHPTGVVYEQVGDWPSSVEQLPVFDPAWLEPNPSGSMPEQPTPQPPPTTGRRSNVESMPNTLTAGERNNTLFREACRLRRHGWSDAEMARGLLGVNRERCRPPLETTEVEAIARSAATYEPASDDFPATDTGSAEFFATVAQWGGALRPRPPGVV